MLRDLSPDTRGAPAELVLDRDEFGSEIRWQPGERLEQLFEAQCDRMRESGRAGHLAVEAQGETLTYAQLDGRANRLARYLLAAGLGAGCRVALLLDDAVLAYVGMLGVLKAGAAYVPLDAGFPPDRVAFIVADAEVSAVLSLRHLRSDLGELGVPVICLDEAAGELAAHAAGRLLATERGESIDELAYIIYTSGSTGRPKGVAVEHASICNFVRVAAQVYGIHPEDRVYQGLTIAFDFSVEEIWVPWLSGATLVPRPTGPSLLGPELHQFLAARRITAMCCVPTLLSTIEDDLPDLRFLLVSGEACPHDLIVRWHRDGRRFLNVYGPTEATVTATWSVVHPDRPTTIGIPLPTYSIVILDREDPSRALPHGEVGEIGIAGVGLAAGYVGRPDLTEKAFIPDFLGIPRNPSRRIYRTGDLGRVDEDGELEYRGRIDLQVKIRGYRVELSEIESVMLEVPAVAQAVVGTYEPVPGTVELVGYYSLRRDSAPVDPAQIQAFLRDRLPSYMVPAYLEHLSVIPMTTSDKADRKRLPPPTRRGVGTDRPYVAPRGATEAALAGALARTLGVDRISVDSHFFDDLGMNSLLLAQFSARVREETVLAPPAMKDLYLNPTIGQLAGGVGARRATATVPVGELVPSRRFRYLLCGLAQLLVYVAYTCVVSAVVVTGVEWMDAAPGLIDRWERGIVLTAGVFVFLSAVPVIAKWLLVGRWKRVDFPLWGVRYLRFWVVRLLIRVNPMVLFVGSPLYNVYLRALGARIGRNVVILSRNVPVCTDLLRIGDDTVIRKDSFFNGYRAYAGRIYTGSVTLGADVFVSEQTVLDIGSAMGDGAQLGHASSLQTGQIVPVGESWHGTPGQPSDVDFRSVGPAQCGQFRRFVFATTQLVSVFLYAPIAIAVLLPLVKRVPLVARVLPAGAEFELSLPYFTDVLIDTTVLFLGGLFLSLILVTTVPRLFQFGLRPDTVYPLYGVRYWFQRTLARVSNSIRYMRLFGDSSAIVHYLRVLGYDLGRPVVQSGSNFGVEVKHESPYLSTVGSGTMVSDGLSFMNAEYSSTSFRVRRTVLGVNNFLGNDIVYPAGGRTGDDCLLATKVMIPLDGEVREGVGLLGSPSFEIPRHVERDKAFDHLLENGEERLRRLRAKNAHNTLTAGMFLLAQLANMYGVLLIGLFVLDQYEIFGLLAAAVATLASLLFSLTFFVLLDRASTWFRTLTPQFCSIYDPYFWWHERHWKLSIGPFIAMFNGTPMKNLVWRALGMRIGREVFDDGCAIPEKSLVTIEDRATLNAGSVIQAHSLEDGTFKSDRVTIGRGCTLGVKAFVHYGVEMQDGSVLGADAFLMKGEVVPPRAHYSGNPAREVREEPVPSGA